MQILEFITFFETTRPTPQPVSMYHGTCADLVAVIQTNGDTIDESTLAEYNATALFEVLSDNTEEDEEIVSDENGDIAVIGPAPKQYFEIPVEIVGNTCVVKWQGNLDSGANAIKIYLRLNKTDDATVVSYPATWTVRFQESPGFNPAMLEPLPEEIDFDLVKYKNAPWVTLSAYNSTLSSFNNTVETLNDSINEISGVTEDLSNDLSTLDTYVTNKFIDVNDELNALDNETANLNDIKADKSDVPPLSNLILLQEPDYMTTYEPRYLGEYPFHLEMNKNPDDEWASYDYIQIDPVMGVRATNQYNEMFDLSYYGLSISEADGSYSTVTGHTFELNTSGADMQKTMSITQDGLEKTVYDYYTGEYTITTIEWPDTSGKLALQDEVTNNTGAISNILNSASNANMNWPTTFSSVDELATTVKAFIDGILGM